MLVIAKGDKFNIAKAITKFRLELGWDEGSGKEIDIDGHAFGCIHQGGNPKLFNDGSHLLSYANPGLKKNGNGSFETPDGSLHHSGDNRTGHGDGADETLTIDVTKLPNEIEEIAIFLTIHEAVSRGQNFSQVSNAFVRLVEEGGKELCSYNLTTEFSTQAVEIGRLVKENGEWKFEAMAAGFDRDLMAIYSALK